MSAGFIAVAAGGTHNLALRADGSIAAWGGNDSGQCDVPAPNVDFLAVAVGTAHGNSLENLLMNPTLADLVGGIDNLFDNNYLEHLNLRLPPDPSLGIDGFLGLAILIGQPPVRQMQIDTGRLDRSVPRLGLERFE